MSRIFKKNIVVLVVASTMFFTSVTTAVSQVTQVSSPTAVVIKADGTYIGEAMGFKGIMTVAVTIKDSLITAVEVVSHRDDRRWFDSANNVIPSAIVEAQTPDVDVVGGATYSSKGIINAVKDALDE